MKDTYDWPPTWPREEGWVCPSNVAECPSAAWHKAHIHFRRFANLTLSSGAETVNDTVTTVTVTRAQHGRMNPDGTWDVEDYVG